MKTKNVKNEKIPEIRCVKTKKKPARLFSSLPVRTRHPAMARHRTSARDCELLASATGATPEKMRLTSRAKTDPPPTAKGAARNTSELEVITSSSPIMSTPASDEDEDEDDDALVTILVDRCRRRSSAAPDEAAVPAPPLPQPTNPPIAVLVVGDDDVLTAPPTVPPATRGDVPTVRQQPFAAGPLDGITAPHVVGRCVMMDEDAMHAILCFFPVH